MSILKAWSFLKDEEEKHDQHDTFIHNIEDIHSSLIRMPPIISKKKFVLTYYEDAAYSQKPAT